MKADADGQDDCRYGQPAAPEHLGQLVHAAQQEHRVFEISKRQQHQPHADLHGHGADGLCPAVERQFSGQIADQGHAQHDSQVIYPPPGIEGIAACQDHP